MRRFACLLLACLLGGGANAAPPRFVVDPAWPPPLPGGWVLGEVSGVAVDGADNVWLLHRPRTVPPAARAHAAPPVIELDPAGHVLRAWGGQGAGFDWFESEHGITIAPDGSVWLGGNGAHDGQVLHFTADGRFLLQIGHPAGGSASNDTTRLGGPADIAVDAAADDIYVADGYRNRRVIVFDARTGAYKRHWGAYGGRPADAATSYDPAAPLPRQFGRPVHCVKLAHDGLVYVCDRQNDRVQVFHHDGSYVGEWRIAPGTRGMGSVWDLAAWPDAGQSLLLDADGSNETVHLLRREDGVVLGAFGQRGRGAGEFRWVHNLAIDSKGDVFTTEVTGGRVQRFVPDRAPP